MAALVNASQQPVVARDLTGLIDLQGKEIISCKYRRMEYIGCGFYLAEEIPHSNSKGKQLLKLIPSELLEKVRNHREYSEKVLLSRNGARLYPKIPHDAVLTEVYLPSGEDRWASAKWQRFEGKELPKDAVIYFLDKTGFGACDVNGNILVKPNIEALKEKYVYGVCSLPTSLRPQSEQKKAVDPNAKFEAPRRYSEGLGLFHDEHWKFGYMDESGKVVIPAKFNSASDFSDGMAAVSPGPEGSGFCFIDKSGAKVSPQFEYVSQFFNGVAVAGKAVPRQRIFSQSHGSYYIDKTFKVISPAFAEAGAFHGNMAVVRPFGEPGKPELGLVDRTFHYKFLCNGDRDFKFKNGFWIIQSWLSPAIALDPEGKEVFRTPEPARLEFGTENLVFRGRNLNQLYFYDGAGRLLCAPRFEKHWLQSTNLPLVGISEGSDWSGKRGIVGITGEWLVQPEKANFDITESDRAIKSKFGRFEKEDWKIQDDWRERELYAFLRQYNPIGMSKSQIEKLLGPGAKQEDDSLARKELDLPPDPSVASYQLNWFGAWCASSTWFAEFRYENDVVTAWRIYKRTDREHNFWIRS